MQGAFYSSISIVAFIILIIIDHTAIFIPREVVKPASKAYRRYALAMLVFFVTDALWGIISVRNNTPLLYADTIIYYIAMAMCVVLWCKYVVTFLEMKNLMAKALNIFAIVFFIADIVCLILNHFIHIFFWFGGDGSYSAHIFRYVALGVQMLLYASVAFQSLVKGFQTPNTSRKRFFTVSVFSYLMMITALVQTLFPLLPIYSMGLMIGICILHVFVYEDEMDEYRHHLSERSDIIANAGFGIWRIRMTPDGLNTMEADDKLQRIFGIEKMGLDPETLYTFYHNRLYESTEELEEDDYADMMEGNVRSRLLCWEHPTKGKIYLRAGGNAHLLENGEQIISGYCGDITEQQLAEDKLRADLEEAMTKANAANEAKSRFLFNMSHDIRTPMNAIMGYTELMEKYADDPVRCEDYRKKIRSSGGLLLSLINNVLEMARIESGKAGLDESVGDIRHFIETLESVFAEQMKEKNIAFRIVTNIEHWMVIADSLKMREIYMNLISNAYKYTPEGGAVTINVVERPGKEPGFIEYTTIIADTGIGMSEEFLPHLFDEFSREKTYTDNKIEGTGLGMPIVKKYLDLMGGSISVESELGKGTVFTLVMTHRLPEEEVAITKKEMKLNQKTFKGKRILLAEDNDLNAEIAEELLSESGFKIERAADGIICLDMLQKSSDGYYDLILMDIQMPNMDGYKATENIRAMTDPYHKNIPIIAMTANAFEEDRQRALDCGMNAHVAKPINIQNLLEKLAEELHLA